MSHHLLLIFKDKSIKSFPTSGGLKKGDSLSKVFLNLNVNDIASVLDDTSNDIGRESTPTLANNPCKCFGR